MQYFKVSQREVDKRFDFTCQHDNHVSPTGYCRQWRDWDEQWKTMHPQDYANYVANREKYHSHGHETAQEAADCYRQYLLDNRLSLMRENSSAQHKCQECGEWTTHFAMLDGSQMWYLCKTHNTREEIEKLFTLSADAEIWSS